MAEDAPLGHYFSKHDPFKMNKIILEKLNKDTEIIAFKGSVCSRMIVIVIFIHAIQVLESQM